MPNSSFMEKRADLRYSFFADADVTLNDGTSVRSQVAEISSHGCYIGTLVPIPAGTEVFLCISDGLKSCTVHGRVRYLHSSNGLGIFGMGVEIEHIPAEERAVMNSWLRDLRTKRSNAQFSPTPEA
jgi:hypothetical protein